jgi:hypothetical protein
VSISDLYRLGCGEWTILSLPFNAKDGIAQATLRKAASRDESMSSNRFFNVRTVLSAAMIVGGVVLLTLWK